MELENFNNKVVKITGTDNQTFEGIYLFNHNIQDIEPSPIATSFADLLMKLY